MNFDFKRIKEYHYNFNKNAKKDYTKKVFFGLILCPFFVNSVHFGA